MTDTDHHTNTDFDVAIIGGGAAGLATAACLATEDLRIVVFDSHFGFEGEKKGDTRTIALLQNSVYLLENLGVWEACAPFAQPLDVMKVVDDTGRFPRVADATFLASELGPDPFGYNIPNDKLVTVLAHHVHAGRKATLYTTRGVVDIVTEPDRAVIVTEEGARVSASLVVGADGPNSLARRKAGIDTHDWAYDQTAIACWFSHSLPHHNVSTEFHRPAGPLVVVPMQGDQCGLVWVEAPREAERLLALDDEAFGRELERAIHSTLGSIGQISRRSSFRLAGLTANEFAKGRTALVSHAAHVIPPIGAQGLNLGLRDAAMLADIVCKAHIKGEDVGGVEVVKAYDAARRADILSRTFTVDMLNRSLLFGWFLPFQALRGIGVQLLNRIAPLRKAVMREGLAPQASLPPLMQPRRRAA
jgi:2-octaprenyl-6-methoxyphenol hydroxylase